MRSGCRTTGWKRPNYPWCFSTSPKLACDDWWSSRSPCSSACSNFRNPIHGWGLRHIYFLASNIDHAILWPTTCTIILFLVFLSYSLQINDSYLWKSSFQFSRPKRQVIYKPVIHEDDDMVEAKGDPLGKLMTKLNKLNSKPLVL